mmetsp:Transcript_45521/g.131864  ORF Transcript_45521/g.131864 Transcript_45521/m.131864 type:complete len:256 (-) Transcript_45521:57-824(-)
MGLERLSVLCARIGLCSRSEAVRYIRLGLIAVNGAPVYNAASLVPSDSRVELLDRGQRMQSSKVTLMLHKPLHYASCRAAAGQPLARCLLVPANRAQSCKTRHDPSRLSRLAAADALDAALTGLLVFSQDGRVATRISRSPSLEKEYTVQCVGGVTGSQLAAFREGLALTCSDSLPAGSEPIVGCDVSAAHDGSEQLRVTVRGPIPPSTLCQMCDAAGLCHLGVARTRIGGLSLGDLICGQWTVVRADDIFASHE